MQDDRVETLPTEATKREGSAKITRDEMGFVTSEMPHLTLPQIQFLLALATYGSVDRAREETGASAEDVVEWLADSDFSTTFAELLSNKRETVKQVGQQLTPMLLLTLTNIMETGNNKERLGAAKLIAQMQGLLITRNTVVDASALETLRERLMAPRPIYKELSHGKTP